MPEEDLWATLEDEQQFSPERPDFEQKNFSALTLQQFSDLMSELFLAAKSLSFDRILALWDEFNFAILKLISSRRKTCEASNPDLKVGETETPTWSEEEFTEVTKIFSPNPDGSRDLIKTWRISHGNTAIKIDGSTRLDGRGFSNADEVMSESLPVESSFPELSNFFEFFGNLVSGFRGLFQTFKRSVSGNGDILSNDWFLARDMRLFKGFMKHLNERLLDILRGVTRAEQALSPNSGKDCCPNRKKHHRSGRRRRQRKLDHISSDYNEQNLDHRSHEKNNNLFEITPRCQSPPNSEVKIDEKESKSI